MGDPVSQLVDWQIEAAIKDGTIGLEPFDPDLIQPASIDVRLGEWFRSEHDLVFKAPGGDCPEVMYAGQFLLAHTLETLRLPPDLAARVDGKSTIGRQGLAVHVTAGFVDPGFEGQLTLELVNHSQLKQFQLHPGMLIAQISFHTLDAVPRRPYGHPDLGSHYQGQTGPTGAWKGGRNGSPT